MKSVETEEELWEQVGGASFFVIDFYTSWCGPCKRIAPFLEKMASDFPSITFLKVDGDSAEDLVDFFKIEGFPTFIIGAPKDDTYDVHFRIVGADEAQLHDAVSSLSSLSSSLSSSSLSSLSS